ncbi:protein-L-isoaspartate O-methyltransferase [Verticiella sediminum]|uniref:Protein-L-isoaspartate O-methyltransferase n=1 Tax=Verticiella sediminum TaxID=1247510 RepID=A0A556A7V0_9BURK|nr:protein-L-isoaspartate O-methyltransferase [Verticiella sediminum]TSH88966.1 protein-L-isoaspartate O-methyltransferase [Verticiella sediminum]
MNAATLSDIEQARFNMVEQQIRPAGVLDEAVLDSLFAVRREQFVAPAMRALAFSDIEIPLRLDGADTGESMLTPKLEAQLTEALKLSHTESVLEIGTGSGYQAALLAYHVYQVTSVEINPRLAAFAAQNLQRNGVTNVHVETGDAHNGWGSNEYDAILVTGSVPETIPDGLKYQLRVNGRLVIVVGTAPVMTVKRVTRTSAATFETENLFETLIRPLRGVTASKFKF